MSLNSKRFFALLVIGLNLLSFQNCAGGFESQGQFSSFATLDNSQNSVDDKQCRHPVTNQTVTAGTLYDSFSSATGTSQTLCQSYKITSICDAVTGNFLPTPRAHSSCVVEGVQGQTCSYTMATGTASPTGTTVNSTVTGYTMNTATYPALCGSQVSRTCQANGQWSGTVPVYTACAQRCLHPQTNQAVAANSTYVYYTVSSASTQTQCDNARMTSTCQSNTGVFSPAVATTRHTSCTVQQPPTTPLPPATGFVADSGFTVSGTVQHNGLLTIRASQTSFDAKSRGAAAWLWDIVSRQYMLGNELNTYQGLSSGEEISNQIWTGTQQAGVGKRCRIYTDRPLRHNRISASYGTVATSSSDNNNKGVVKNPAWPYDGAQNNPRLYASWWMKVKNPYGQASGGGSDEDKIFRMSDTSGNGAGDHFWSLGGRATSIGKAWGSGPLPTSNWQRFEVYIDIENGIFDGYINGTLTSGGYSALGGYFEFRPSNQYLRNTVNNNNTAVSRSAFPAGNITANMIGWDDAGVSVDSYGQEVDISEIYLDVTQMRLEVSDQPTWNVIDSASAHYREVQGRIQTWNANEISFYVNQGGFSTLSGKYLYVIRENGSAIRIGRFQ